MSLKSPSFVLYLSFKTFVLSETNIYRWTKKIKKRSDKSCCMFKTSVQQPVSDFYSHFFLPPYFIHYTIKEKLTEQWDTHTGDASSKSDFSFLRPRRHGEPHPSLHFLRIITSPVVLSRSPKARRVFLCKLVAVMSAHTAWPAGKLEFPCLVCDLCATACETSQACFCASFR